MRRCEICLAGRTFAARRTVVSRRASGVVACSLAAFPILLMVGAANDYARLLRSREDLQRALDAAVLVGARAPASSRASIAGPLLAAGAAHASITLGGAHWRSNDDGSFTGVAIASERLLFGSVLGLEAARIGASATAQADGLALVARLTN